MRRDRHDRGLSGPVLPHNAPFHKSPDQFFIHHMDQALTEYEHRLGDRLTKISIAIEPVPSERDFVISQGVVPLGRIERGNPSLIVLYQRPIEMRGQGSQRLVRVLRDVLAELIARVLGLEPFDVDPDYLGPQFRD